MDDSRGILAAEGLSQLFDALQQAGFTTVGPVRRDDTISIDVIASSDELPRGWIDVQEAGQYALEQQPGERFFDYTNGPQSWRRFLRPPREPMWTSTRDGATVEFQEPPRPTERYALIGVRSCDLHALQVLDTVLTDQDHRDERYTTRRRGAFVVAVQCARAGATCFCASMETGPRADRGFDLALTELPDPHCFLVEVGSDAGREIADQLDLAPAAQDDWDQALEVSRTTAASMGRHVDTDGLRELLLDNLEHPDWDEVAGRCLSCANCTMVCPTCFCTTTEIDTNLEQTRAEHTQVWDSCFHAGFTYMHGGAVRDSTRSRYRQWLTHKLATWHDQFGQSGCVGCGRCVTWCPVGIDLTDQVARLREGHE